MNNVVEFPAKVPEEVKTERATKQVVYLSGAIRGLIAAAASAAGVPFTVGTCGHGRERLVVQTDEEGMTERMEEIYGKAGAKSLAVMLNELTGIDPVTNPQQLLRVGMASREVVETMLKNNEEFGHLYNEASVEVFNRLTAPRAKPEE